VGEPYVNIKVITDLKNLTKNKRKVNSDAVNFKLTARVKRVLNKLKMQQLGESLPASANYVVSVD